MMKKYPLAVIAVVVCLAFTGPSRLSDFPHLI